MIFQARVQLESSEIFFFFFFLLPESVKKRKVCNKLHGKKKKKNHSGQRTRVRVCSLCSSSASLTFMTDVHIVAGSGVQAEIHILSGKHRLRIRSSPRSSCISSCVYVCVCVCITVLCGMPVFGVINEERHNVACPYPHTYELTLSGPQFSTFLIFSCVCIRARARSCGSERLYPWRNICQGRSFVGHVPPRQCCNRFASV